jgi:hypothetical protein
VAVAVALPELAVIVACPVVAAGVQTMLFESNTPAHTAPPLVTVAKVVLLLLNVMSAAIAPPAEL